MSFKNYLPILIALALFVCSSPKQPSRIDRLALVNCNNYQSERLRIYMPGNGGFLKAVSLMCAGWEGCTTENPGFPKDGKWNVKWEGLRKDFGLPNHSEGGE